MIDGTELPAAPSIDGADRAVATRHRPILSAPANEPYPPLAMGWTVFRGPAASPSSKFAIEPKGAIVIEYAVWYDYDIGHLYDLEHVWVHVGADGGVIAVEASRHGKRLDMSECAREGDRSVLVIEPGKHAHWPSDEAMATARDRIREDCARRAGLEGVHTGNRFAESGGYTVTPLQHRVARLKMLRDAFEPNFAKSVVFSDVTLVPWATLEAWIPSRVRHLMDEAVRTTPHIEAVLLDCGDTLIDELTQDEDPVTEIATTAVLIPGADRLLDGLRDRGYRLALVADGPHATFHNILGLRRGYWDRFETHVISGDVGVHKPDPRMFETALANLGLDRSAAGRVVMVGNNLSRDIAGANRMGIISVFMGWSRRRTHVPANADETPDHTVFEPAAVLEALDRIERTLPNDDASQSA